MSRPQTPPTPHTTTTIKKENRRAVQQLRRANRATVTHVNGWEHPLSSPRLQFWRSFCLAAVSLSPPNLIGKPRACHSVLAAHIRTNALRENDTNLSVRWQKNDARGREALARGEIYGAVTGTCLDVHLSGGGTESTVRPQVIPAEWLQARAAQQYGDMDSSGVIFYVLKPWKVLTLGRP